MVCLATNECELVAIFFGAVLTLSSLSTDSMFCIRCAYLGQPYLSACEVRRCPEWSIPKYTEVAKIMMVQNTRVWLRSTCLKPPLKLARAPLVLPGGIGNWISPDSSVLLQ
jgi:hypothetical protein